MPDSWEDEIDDWRTRYAWMLDAKTRGRKVPSTEYPPVPDSPEDLQTRDDAVEPVTDEPLPDYEGENQEAD